MKRRICFAWRASRSCTVRGRANGLQNGNDGACDDYVVDQGLLDVVSLRVDWWVERCWGLIPSSTLSLQLRTRSASSDILERVCAKKML